MDRKILKNSAWLFLAQTIVKGISFFYTIFLARSLGVENFGFYTVALAYFALLSVFSDFGINRYLIREGSRHPENVSSYVITAALTRLVLTSVVLIIFVVWLYLFDTNLLRTNLSLLAALAVLPQSVALTFDAALVALQKLRLSALALLTLGISTAFSGVILLSFGLSTFGAVGALIIGQAVYVFVLMALLLISNVHLLAETDFTQMKKAFLGSAPYAILGVLGLLYYKIDALLLSYLKGAVETGYYGAAYKFLEAIVFIPSALAAASFPVIAKYHDINLPAIKKIYFDSLKILGVISIPIFLGYFFILPIIIKLLLPNYLPSIEAVKVLALSIPFMFLHVPGALVLISSDKFLKPVIYLSLITLSFNVLTNLAVIPAFGFMGAAWVTVASETLSFIIFFILLYQKVLKYA